MNETRVVRLTVKESHAKQLRAYVTKAMRALPKDVANTYVHIFLQDLASKVDEAFAVKSNVVPLRSRGDGPGAA